MKKPNKVQKVMHEFKTGTLHSGKGGKGTRKTSSKKKGR